MWGHLPKSLSIFIFVVGLAGFTFMSWRTYVSVESGSIWLRGQNIHRQTEPVWFWMYVATYVLIGSAMLYAMYSASGS